MKRTPVALAIFVATGLAAGPAQAKHHKKRHSSMSAKKKDKGDTAIRRARRLLDRTPISRAAKLN
jgi:hypothetical protein